MPPLDQADTALDQAQIDRALARLKSSYEGVSGIAETVGLGPAAIPALRTLLFERERSGLYQARCRAVEALAALKAFNVLAEFLRAERPISDAVERLGEDVVVSAAARSLARARDDWVYDLLRDLATRKVLNGVLAGLGTFMRTDSIPIFVNALAEDEVRLTAESILRRFGNAARQALFDTACKPENIPESESYLRKRRSALTLLLDLDIPPRMWSAIRSLDHDSDPEIASLAGKACASFGMPTVSPPTPDR